MGIRANDDDVFNYNDAAPYISSLNRLSYSRDIRPLFTVRVKKKSGVVDQNKMIKFIGEN